ncbi:fimbria/pilus outer membrane usher protein [Klebsiella sp. BIGb0407]|uniref:fimbria/pilus outer membrane usher protein n=1 Tax=Klebsiella sp. BIGb0407 TaxID=2940603 RepID=UPI002168575E|nr:fimbria/pilus outer membrane usher protein [Klebsiella sp. BIGb0407]MCS3429670.1 outer membrane usher protein [Klebsiella sp. BIGb0407]
MSKSLPVGLRSKLSPLTIAVLSTFFLGGICAEDVRAAVSDSAMDMEFDSSFLNVDDNKTVDLSRFNRGSSGSPGTYKTAVYVNDQLVSNTDVVFFAREDKSVYPCLTVDILKNIAFDYDKLPANFFTPKAGETCIDLQHKLPQAYISYDSNEQRLNIAIPQIYMQNVARGTVSPELWDKGIPALLLGYNVNGYRSESRGQTFDSLFAGLNAGLNVGAWYLRHNGSFTKMDNESGSYSNMNTYLQRDIPILKARALIGQSNTSGDLFDTLPYSGVQLATDERMLPESLRGYAPEIRGIARTNARVTVRQGGQVLYETNVPPGAFVINDLYPTGYGGDLNVTVREADGSEQNFSVPYAAVAQLLRPGTSRYTFTAGKLRSDNIRGNPALYQATYQRGLNNSLTGYSGLQLSQNYYALKLGTAVGTPVGAFSFDVTQARTLLGQGYSNTSQSKSGSNSSGQSYQFSYSKLINETNSNISLAAYRFSTDGYMDFITAMQTRDAVQTGLSPDAVRRAKNRITLTYGQGLPNSLGQLYVSGSVQNYWNKEGTDEQYQLGYNTRYKQLNWGVSISRSFSSYGAQQTNYLLSFSLPLGRDDYQHTPQLRTDLTYDTNGRTGQQVAISGTSGEDSQFNYGVTAMHANQNTGTTGSLSGNYRSSATSMTASASTGKSYHSLSAGLSGTVVGHSGGVTFTPYTSDTFALVEAKGAEGAKVTSYPGVRIDSKGFAVVPYLNPYQMNDISIDPKGMSDQTELVSASQKTAPYSGAVVKMKYDTKTGSALLVNATWNGQPVPFGADVFDSQGNNVGTTGQGGQIYARVIKDKDQLHVKWGNEHAAQCSIDYQLIPVPKERTALSLQQFDSICR